MNLTLARRINNQLVINYLQHRVSNTYQHIRCEGIYASELLGVSTYNIFHCSGYTDISGLSCNGCAAGDAYDDERSTFIGWE